MISFQQLLCCLLCCFLMPAILSHPSYNIFFNPFFDPSCSSLCPFRVMFSCPSCSPSCGRFLSLLLPFLFSSGNPFTSFLCSFCYPSLNPLLLLLTFQPILPVLLPSSFCSNASRKNRRRGASGAVRRAHHRRPAQGCEFLCSFHRNTVALRVSQCRR